MDNYNDEIWVFLSHSHKDYEKVLKVRNLLEKDSFRPIMFFLRCLEDEDEVDNLIKREIDSRKRFILCDSENARESKWVQREVEYIKSRDRVFETVNLDDSIENIAETLLRFRIRSTVYIKGYSSGNLATYLYNALKKEEFRVYNVFDEKEKLLKKYEDKKTAFLANIKPDPNPDPNWRLKYKSLCFGLRFHKYSGFSIPDRQIFLSELFEDSEIYKEIGVNIHERLVDSRLDEEILVKLFERLVDSRLDDGTKDKLLELLEYSRLDKEIVVKLFERLVDSRLDDRTKNKLLVIFDHSVIDEETRGKLLKLLEDPKIDEETRKKLLTIINQLRTDNELYKLHIQKLTELEEIKETADDYLQKSSDDGYVIYLISCKEVRKDRKRLEKTLSNLKDNDIVVAVDDILADNLSKNIRRVLEDHALIEVHGLSVDDKAEKIVSYLKKLDISLYGENKTM